MDGVPRQRARIFRPSAEQEQAMRALNTRGKQELTRFLALRPEGTTALEVAERFKISRPSAQIRLTELENAGIVVADRPKGQRRGRVVRFTVDHARLDELMRRLTDYAHGR